MGVMQELAEFVQLYGLSFQSMTDIPSGMKTVNTYMLWIGMIDDAQLARQLCELLKQAAIEYPRITEGLSYIEWGAMLGHQGTALVLLGMGELCGFWKVITPEMLGATGAIAADLAGQGFIMASGLKLDC